MALFVTQNSCFSTFEYQVWFGWVRKYHQGVTGEIQAYLDPKNYLLGLKKPFLETQFFNFIECFLNAFFDLLNNFMGQKNLKFYQKHHPDVSYPNQTKLDALKLEKKAFLS